MAVQLIVLLVAMYADNREDDHEHRQRGEHEPDHDPAKPARVDPAHPRAAQGADAVDRFAAPPGFAGSAGWTAVSGFGKVGCGHRDRAIVVGPAPRSPHSVSLQRS